MPGLDTASAALVIAIARRHINASLPNTLIAALATSGPTIEVAVNASDTNRMFLTGAVFLLRAIACMPGVLRS
jgi:mRNA-degrading endonuclease toxin of MazEF toxin-antitoxin module